MVASGKCIECGKAIPGDSPGGFCAPCLMGLALRNPGEPSEPGIGAILEAEAGSSPEQPDVLPRAAGVRKGAGWSASENEGPGHRIGFYRLLQEIGHGGCGVVYMAEQQRPVRRRVALKIIKLGMDTRQVIARFEAERQALALMDHPNIAKVLDAGTTDAGRPYFVMELVGGIKITDYCDQNNLNLRQRLELFIRTCRAIQHAHQKGIIHRDIKPSNVLVATQDGEPAPKVIDFGIAKATQGKLTDQTLFTAFEQFLGTPAYMSPEQAQLGSLDVDTRSDIYSLGVLLYEVLTGKTPFDTTEMLAAGLDEMRRTIREKEPPKPSTRLTQELAASGTRMARSSTRLAPACPEQVQGSSRRLSQTRELVGLLRGDVDWIVMKCLEKDRARRYETANDLAADIERHLNQQPVVARPPSWSYALQKFVRRNRVLVGASALAGLALVLGVVGSTWQAIRAVRAEQAQSRLRQEAQAARQDATDKLWSSRLAEAKARRLSGQSGQRFESLRALGEAAAIRPSRELRSEAIASMALDDIRWTGEKAAGQAGLQVSAAANLECYADIDSLGALKIRRISDDSPLGSLPAIGKVPRVPASFSPDGHYLVVLDADHRNRVWDWASPSIAAEFAATCSYAFTDDSKNIAIFEGTNVVIHNLASRESLGTISLGGLSPEAEPGAMAFNPSGRLLAVASGSGTNVLILDATSGRRLQTLPNTAYIYSIRWHPDGRRVATACNASVIFTWDAETGERLNTIPSEQVVSLSFNHKGDVLISSGWDGKTRLFEFPTGRPLVSIYKSGSIVGFSANDSVLATRNWDGTALEFFEVVSGTGLRTIHATGKGVSPPGGVALFSSSGRYLAHSTPQGAAVWDIGGDRVVGAVSEEDSLPVWFDAREENLFVEAAEGLKRWSFKERPARTIAAEARVLPQARLGGAAVSADGTTCAVTSEEGWRVVRTDTFTELARIVTVRDAFGKVLSPDGALFAIGGRFRPGVRVWNAHTGVLLKELPVDAGHGEPSASVAFSPDGRYLVTSTVKEYCFWNTASWSPARHIAQEPRNDFPASMAFSSDGRLFAGTHSRNIVRLFDAATAHTLADLEAPNCKFISSLSFNGGGTLLAACESREVVWIWDLRAIRNRLAAMNLDWETPPK